MTLELYVGGGRTELTRQLLPVQHPATNAERAPQQALGHDEEPDWARDLVQAAGAAMGGSSFPATPSSGCRTCPVRSSCPMQPEGQQL